jgi:uncharacterized protein YjbI with pentapeptide repeats
MTAYGRTPRDVRRWPNDAAARQALEDYFSALPSDPKIVIPSLNAEGLDFTEADLSGIELLGAELSEANLSGVRLVGAHLGGAWLEGTSLRGADLSHASLRKAHGRGCDAQGVVAVETDFRRAEFEEANLTRADLRSASLGNARFWHTDLRGADLRDCTFGASQSWTSLNQARIAGCKFGGAHGSVAGPVDIGADSPHLLDGKELAQWFAEQGAQAVAVREPVSH